MAIDPEALRIVYYPDPVLRQTAHEVEPHDPQVQAVAQRMIELMHQARGIGLAAPQVALPWRLFVANPTGEPDDDRVFINPQLTDASPHIAIREEGCLSIPGVTCEIRRPRQITITATGLDGQTFTLTNDDLPARVWQHETDHLDGILILDKMSPMDRIANRKAIKELEQGTSPARV